MLRLRPKPPVGIPHLNSGKEWSADDIADLDELLHDRAPISHIAEYPRRDEKEIPDKIAERER
jgi:hypothetical protein